MKIGYARVSTKDQNLERQLKALEAEGCDKIFYDKISTRKERPERQKAFDSLKDGDTFVFLDLDRVFRSIVEALNTFEEFEAKGVKFKCLNNSYLNTTGEQDKVGKVLQKIVRSLISGFAEMEREMNHERTMEGLITAKERGKVGGRPSKANDPKFVEQVKEIHILQGSSDKSIRQLCELFDVPIATYYRHRKNVGK
jgi:DNA invertase Pin-like site-specific DNA recombinase